MNLWRRPAAEQRAYQGMPSDDESEDAELAAIAQGLGPGGDEHKIPQGQTTKDNHDQQHHGITLLQVTASGGAVGSFTNLVSDQDDESYVSSSTSSSSLSDSTADDKDDTETHHDNNNNNHSVPIMTLVPALDDELLARMADMADSDGEDDPGEPPHLFHDDQGSNGSAPHGRNSSGDACRNGWQTQVVADHRIPPRSDETSLEESTPSVTPTMTTTTTTTDEEHDVSESQGGDTTSQAPTEDDDATLVRSNRAPPGTYPSRAVPTSIEHTVRSSRGGPEMDIEKGRPESAEMTPPTPSSLDHIDPYRSKLCFVIIFLVGMLLVAMIGVAIYAGVALRHKPVSESEVPTIPTDMPVDWMVPTRAPERSPTMAPTTTAPVSSPPVATPTVVPATVPPTAGDGPTMAPSAECRDTNIIFDIDGTRRNCVWLSEQSIALQLIYCQAYGLVNVFCPRTCNNCG